MVVNGWASLAEFTAYLQPQEVAGWANLAEFTLRLQPQEVAGWARVAELTLILHPQEVPAWAKLREYRLILQPRIECSIDADCPQGYVCIGGVCVEKGAGVPWLPLAIGAGALGTIILISSRKKEKKHEELAA